MTTLDDSTLAPNVPREVPPGTLLDGETPPIPDTGKRKPESRDAAATPAPAPPAAAAE